MSMQDEDVDANSATGSRDATNNPLWLQSIPIEEAHYLSRFDFPSSLPFQQANSTEIQEIAGSSMEKGQSSGTKRKHDSDPLDMQDEAGVEGFRKKSHERRQTSCTEARKLNQRLRRQRFNDKMKALQDQIPNSNKRDIVSTLDDAITYIKAIQHQFQEQQMLIQACYSMCQMTTMPQPMQQRTWVPFLAPFLPRGGIGTGMGMPGMFDFRTSQLGLPNPHLASSGLPSLGGISASNPGNHVLEPFPLAASSMDLATLSAISSGLQCMTTGETSPSVCEQISKPELSDYPCDK